METKLEYANINVNIKKYIETMTHYARFQRSLFTRYGKMT